jgi:hypothetical protein
VAGQALVEALITIVLAAIGLFALRA